jgi:hypothetical protein
MEDGGRVKPSGKGRGQEDAAVESEWNAGNKRGHDGFSLSWRLKFKPGCGAPGARMRDDGIARV